MRPVLYATNVPNGRSMTLRASGTIFVGSRTGKVYALVDQNHKNKADEVITIARGLYMRHFEMAHFTSGK